MKKSPGFWFFTGDWLKDPELRFCSLFARGLLVDLLCYMFEAKEQGFMTWADGSPRTDREIVDAISGGSTEEKLSALEELVKKGVLSRDSRGAIYSRRLSKLKEVSEARRKSGSKGGSKKLANRLANEKQKRGVTDTVSVSVSDSDTVTDTVNTPPVPQEPTKPKKSADAVGFDDVGFLDSHNTPDMRSAWDDWVQFRERKRKPISDDGGKETAAMLCKLPIRESIAAIRRTISKDWQGLQPCPRNELHLYLPKNPDEIDF